MVLGIFGYFFFIFGIFFVGNFMIFRNFGLINRNGK